MPIENTSVHLRRSWEQAPHPRAVSAAARSWAPPRSGAKPLGACAPSPAWHGWRFAFARRM